MKRLDWTAWGFISVIVAVLLGVYFTGSHISLEVSLKGSDSQNSLQVGPKGPLEFSFSRPVQPNLLSPMLQITPATAGKISWTDALHAQFIPDQPFQPDQQYSVTLQRGALGTSGEKISQDKTWHFKLRSQMIVYISAEPNRSELWTVGIIGNDAPRQLTHTNGSVYDYAASPDGEQVVYSVLNQQKGFDLWITDRDGQNNHVLLNCGGDRCYSVAWSPDLSKLAYTRQNAGLSPTAPLGAPRPWLLDPNTGETSPLYSDSQKLGYGPVWSPDGQKIASWDGVSGGIRIYNSQSKTDVLIPDQSGLVGSWSLDSRQMYYTDIVENSTTAQTRVFTANAASGQTQQILDRAGFNINGNYDVPVLSPKGNWMAAGIQSLSGSATYQMRLLTMDKGQDQEITNDPDSTDLDYSWNNRGTGLLFQKMPLTANEASEVDIWWLDRRQLQIIAKDASTPSWLP
ncbi:MAG: Ig-like domain-containing protein [Anaerolineaceae bacterium]|nr:Ig-like domain-containing protein [Anaerolineaceae bacterium]